ncbi:hypothetical protein VDG1235_803 [Verrucomicrobiia bacterium DG1235]|nr:hypothetical protein VDG1235_803 [Verrucomicrobiae bacterium DG1235]
MIESEIKKSLLQLQGAIAEADAGKIKESMSFIDKSLKTHRRELDAQLKHYLKNRSYMKALAYLGGEDDIPAGRCAGRTDFS